MARKTAAADLKQMFPEDLKSYFEEHRAGTYTLLDVRQPAEYEEGHLAGAQLIPLPRLLNSLTEIDPQKPAIVYCAVGGRSQMGAQLLLHEGFREVFHLIGGLEAWEGSTANGPVQFHLQFVRGSESPEEIIKLAYRMEEGLKRFHQEVKARTENEELSQILRELIRAEEKHKEALLKLVPTEGERERIVQELSEVSQSDLMEGGMGISDFLEQNQRFLTTVKGYLELAMMVETQALDLYLRMGDASQHEITQNILFEIGEEEKKHLGILGRFMEQKVRESKGRG